MPGPLPMADNAPPTPKPALSAAVASAPETVDPSKSPALNGAAFHPPSLPRQSESNMRSSLSSPPPELRHWSEDYQPLSKVFTRATQEAFNSLNDLISDLAKLPEIPHLNGASSHSDGAVVSAAGAQRRLKWLEFANTQRQRFIKLLVISQWSRRIKDIQMLVDINLWLSEQQGGFAEAQEKIVRLRWELSQARLRSPDIPLALEVLRTGKANSIDRMGYVPETPLSATDTLKTLQNLNVLLHLRLNLHETIPPRFKEFKIQSGRVTFIVPHEFEIDLSIADEDPSSQFWFVDFRLTFAHISKTTANQLRAPLERHVNAVLAQEGLSGCYEFLHEFTLTHKLHSLRKQAFALSRNSWAGSLRIDSMHRCLVVQYWVNRPGRRSWIQLGINSGQTPNRRDAQVKSYSHLFVKCVQNGKEASEASFAVPDADLNFEAILRRATAHHMTAIFSRLQSRYDTMDANASRSDQAPPLNVEYDHIEQTLGIPLATGQKAMVSMEQTLGDFALRPVTAVSDRYQSILNNLTEPIEDPFPVIERWRASLAQKRAEQLSINNGFAIRSIPGLTLDNVKLAFGSQVTRVSLFTRESWAESGWFVCVAVDPYALQWWIARAEYRGRQAFMTFPEPMTELQTLCGPPSYPLTPTSDIERIVIAKITLNALTRFLGSRGVHSSAEIRAASSSTVAASLKFDARAMIEEKGFSGVGPTTLASARADESVSLLMHGFDRGHVGDGKSLVTYTAKGCLDRAKVRPNLLSQLQGPDLDVDSRGRFSLKLRSELASVNVISQLSLRLQSLQRLSFFLVVLSKYGMESRSVAESQITFEYCKDPELTASVTFASQETGSTTLELMPLEKNPQTPILRFLRATLNPATRTSPGEACENFFRMLGATLPAALALEKAKANDPSASHFNFEAHSARHYIVRYPRVNRAFRMGLWRHRKNPQWAIAQILQPAREGFEGQDKVDEQIKALLSRSGTAWEGRKDCILASPHGLQDAFAELHKTLQECEPLVKKTQPQAPPAQAKGRTNNQQTQQTNGTANSQKKGQTAAQKKQAKTNSQPPPQARATTNGTAKIPNNSSVVVID